MFNAGTSTTELSIKEVSTAQISTTEITVTEMLGAKASITEISNAETSATEKSAAENFTTEMSAAEILHPSTIFSMFKKKCIISSRQFLSFRKLNKQQIKLMPLGLRISFLTLSNLSKQIKYNPSAVCFLS